MGLDVKVYQNIELVDGDDYDFLAFTLDGFEGRIKNLVWDGKYNGECVAKLISYSCSTHNRFRDALAVMLGKKEDFWWTTDVGEDIPFYELFEFADNEGCMDWGAANNLYNDFLEYQPMAMLKIPDWKSDYNDWMEIFRLAKDNGVVVFY